MSRKKEVLCVIVAISAHSVVILVAAVRVRLGWEQTNCMCSV